MARESTVEHSDATSLKSVEKGASDNAAKESVSRLASLSGTALRNELNKNFFTRRAEQLERQQQANILDQDRQLEGSPARNLSAKLTQPPRSDRSKTDISGASQDTQDRKPSSLQSAGHKQEGRTENEGAQQRAPQATSSADRDL